LWAEHVYQLRDASLGGLQERVLHPDVVAYTLKRFEEELETLNNFVRLAEIFEIFCFPNSLTRV
jgi:hypothetical protein